MKPPLYTDSDPRFLEAIGYVFCLSVVVCGLLASFAALKGSNNTELDTEEQVDIGDDYTLHCERVAPEDFNRIVEEAGKIAGVNPRIIALTVYRESKCDPLAIGADGEIGLGQVYPSVWESTLIEEGIIESVEDLYDPRVNLQAVGFILSESLRYAKGDPRDALRRYNGSGPAAQRYATEQYLVYRDFWGETPWF